MLHLLKWLYPGMKLKRWLALFAIGVLMVSFGLALALNYEYLGRAEEAIFKCRSQLVIAAGCIVGMHRSVFVANLEHRDLMKNDVWEV